MTGWAVWTLAVLRGVLVVTAIAWAYRMDTRIDRIEQWQKEHDVKAPADKQDDSLMGIPL